MSAGMQALVSYYPRGRILLRVGFLQVYIYILLSFRMDQDGTMSERGLKKVSMAKVWPPAQQLNFPVSDNS